MIAIAQRLEGISEYYFSAKLREIAQLRARGRDVLNMGIGSPDLPPAPEVIETLQAQSSNPGYHAYQSYTGAPVLREAFAHWYRHFYGVELDHSSEILPLIGSKEGIMHIAMTYLEPGDAALVPNPGYPAYRACSMLAGAEVLEYDLTAANGWFPDLKALEQLDLRRVKIMWVNYPHMPTGTAGTTELFERLVAFGLKHNILIVNDNPYSFILNDNPLSIFSIPAARDIALELNSLSKSHNMAGWRVGMLAGSADYIQDVLRFKSNMDSGMFLPVQMAAAKALQLPQAWYDAVNREYRERQIAAAAVLEAAGCSVLPGQQGMFLWAAIPDNFTDAYELADLLLHQADVFITPGGIFGSNGNGFLRISLCNKLPVYEEALSRIQKVHVLSLKTLEK